MKKNLMLGAGRGPRLAVLEQIKRSGKGLSVGDIADFDQGAARSAGGNDGSALAAAQHYPASAHFQMAGDAIVAGAQ